MRPALNLSFGHIIAPAKYDPEIYFFNGEGEFPIWHVLSDGESIPLVSAAKWRFTGH